MKPVVYNDYSTIVRQRMLLSAGLAAYEDVLYTTEALYNLMVTYAFTQACVLLLMLSSFIQRW